MEFPHLQRLYAGLEKKGLGVLAINDGDTPEAIRKYVKELGLTFKIGVGGRQGGPSYPVFGHYGIQRCPTNYILDAHGQVVYRSIGFDEEAVRATLARLGVE